MTEHTVYKFYNADDDLLYVGVTSQWPGRLDQHRRQTEWFAEVMHHALIHFTTAEQARKAEIATIAELTPRYNRAPGGGGRPPSDPATHRIRSTFSVSFQTLALLDRLAERTGQSKSAVVEQAIRKLAEQEA